MSIVPKNPILASGRFGLLFRRGVGRMKIDPETVCERGDIPKAFFLAIVDGRARELPREDVRRTIDVVFPHDIGRQRNEAFHLFLVFAPPPTTSSRKKQGRLRPRLRQH